MSQDLLLFAEEEVERKDSMTVEDVVPMRVSYSLVFSLWLVGCGQCSVGMHKGDWACV